MFEMGPRLGIKGIKMIAVGIGVEFPKVKKITLIGSYARNEAKFTSDVDLVMKYDSKDISEFAKVSLYMSQVFNIKFGMQTDIFEEREIVEGSPFHKNFLSEGVVMYERTANTD